MYLEGSNIIWIYSSLTISFIRKYSRHKKPRSKWKLRRGKDSKSRNNLKPKQNYAENI